MLTDGPGMPEVVEISDADEESEGKVGFRNVRVSQTVSSLTDTAQLD
jgi:hypothetical protein